MSLLTNTRGVRWHPDFVDLIPADGGKDRGIQRFLDHYGWSKEQAISFGDGGNDVDMLRFTGIGVAMGNATEERRRWPITLPMTSIIMVFGMLSSISTSSDDLPLTVFHFTAASRCMRHHKFPIALSPQ